MVGKELKEDYRIEGRMRKGVLAYAFYFTDTCIHFKQTKMNLALCCVNRSPKHWFVKKESSTDMKGQALVVIHYEHMKEDPPLPIPFLHQKNKIQHSILGLCVNTYNLISSFDSLKLFYFWKVLHSSQNMNSVYLWLLLFQFWVFYSKSLYVKCLHTCLIFKTISLQVRYKHHEHPRHLHIPSSWTVPSLCLRITWHLPIDHS